MLASRMARKGPLARELIARAHNASPLVLFARIARLDLLERLAPRIIVPSAVFEEVRGDRSREC